MPPLPTIKIPARCSRAFDSVDPLTLRWGNHNFVWKWAFASRLEFGKYMILNVRDKSLERWSCIWEHAKEGMIDSHFAWTSHEYGTRKLRTWEPADCPVWITWLAQIWPPKMMQEVLSLQLGGFGIYMRAHLDGRVVGAAIFDRDSNSTSRVPDRHDSCHEGDDRKLVKVWYLSHANNSSRVSKFQDPLATFYNDNVWQLLLTPHSDLMPYIRLSAFYLKWRKRISPD